jgi:glutathione peroxidase
LSVYQFSANLINGNEKSLSDYSGKVLLIVNTATKCGFTPQLNDLQVLYDKYKDQGFEVLGFPCNQFKNQEPGTNDEVAEVCRMNYGVSFPLFQKIEVKGKGAHPLFQYLVKGKKGLITRNIKWNFTKFLIDKDGNILKRYAPATSPKRIDSEIKRQLSRL